MISIPMAIPTTVSAEDSISDLEQQLQQLEQENQKYQKILDDTKSDIAEKEEYKSALVSKVQVLDEKIAVTREKISSLNDDIKEKQDAYDKGLSEVEDQFDALANRLRILYMSGNATDLEIIFGAKDFSDLIDKMELVKSLANSDKELISEIQTKLDELSTKKKSLEADKKDLETQQASLKSDQDVKITFAFAFLTFVVSTVTAIFTTAAFVKNRIDINSIRDIISNLIKVALIVLLFAIFPAQLYFVTLASFGSGIFLLLANITVKKKVLPEVKADIRKFDIKIVKTLLASGIWLSLAQLCQVLLSGLDLLICNLTLGTALMGLLSIAKTVPNSIGNLTVILGSVFTPHYTILYAKEKIPELIIEVKFSTKIVSFILSTPIAGFIAFGRQFYILWQPTKSPEEITMIQFMSVLTCITFLCSSQTQSLMMINTVCNKLRLPVFVNLTVGIVSVIVAIAACNLTDYGVYFVAGTSSVLMGLRALIFTPAYSAYILKQKLSIFFPTVIRDCVGFIIILVLFSIISNLITVTGWSSFIFICAICGILAYALSLPLLFNKAELCKLKNKLTKK